MTTTTTTDYSALSTPELSALVAERLPELSMMEGTDRLTVEHHPAEDSRTGQPFAMWHDHHAASHRFVLSDPVAYMAVVDAMLAQGWWCVIKTPFEPGLPYFAGFTPHGSAGWNGRPDYDHQDAEIGRAIAVAALRALEGK